MKKILITGGHITPALAVIYELERGDYKILFIGRKYFHAYDTFPSFEYQLIKKRNIPFFDLPSPKLQRENIFSLFAIPVGLLLAVIKSLQIIQKENPDCIVSFGGYIALPVAIAAKISHIPILTHEQTMVMGLANRFIAKISDVVCLSWKNTKYVSSDKEIVTTGNPVRPEFTKGGNKPSFWDKLPSLPKIYITGGSQGSHFINRLIDDNLDSLLVSYVLIHQTGSPTSYNDFVYANQKKQQAPPDIRRRYIIFSHLEESEVAFIMENADLLIGRSGANTLSEILHCRIPSILIPLPWAGGSEQEVHADFIQSHGLGTKILQKEATINKLTDEIARINKNKNLIKSKFSDVEKHSPGQNPAFLIRKEIDRLTAPF